MNKLQIFAQKYINRINDSVFSFGCINNKDLENFKKIMIDYKNEVVDRNVNLSLKDLALVRIMPKTFPINLEYHTLQQDGITFPIDSPFTDILRSIKFDYSGRYNHVDVGCDHIEIDNYPVRLEYPLFRNTKHFSLNGLTSDIAYGSTFTSGKIIAIEPFEDHLEDDLVVLNPVDTFYNLETKSFKVGKNAVFIIDIDTYKKLLENPTIKEDISKVRVVLYSPQNLTIENTYDSKTYLTDFVLSYLGYIPIHSIQQTKLIEEYYYNGKEYVDDSKYLKRFQDFIEFLNQKFLGQSYYFVSEQIKEVRKNNGIINCPGILHAETKFKKEEDRNDLISQLETVRRYLDFLVKNVGLDLDFSNRLYSYYSKFLKKWHGTGLTGSFDYKELEHDMIIFIEKIGYQKLEEATILFNSLTKNKELDSAFVSGEKTFDDNVQKGL